MRNRHPKGSPDGGQFRAGARPESGAELPTPGQPGPALPDFAELKAESAAVWAQERAARDRVEVHSMALIAANIRENHPDASEIALSLGYDSDDACTYVSEVDLREPNGSVIDADEDWLDDLRCDIGQLNIDSWGSRFTDQQGFGPRNRRPAFVESLGVWDTPADEIRIEVGRLSVYAASRLGRTS